MINKINKLYKINNIDISTNNIYSYCFYSKYGVESGGSVSVKNNIIGYTNNTNGYYWYIGGTISGTFTCDYNLYYNSTASSPFYYSGASRNWSYWNGLGFDVNGIGPNTDPVFVNNSGSYSKDIDFIGKIQIERCRLRWQDHHR